MGATETEMKNGLFFKEQSIKYKDSFHVHSDEYKRDIICENHAIFSQFEFRRISRF